MVQELGAEGDRVRDFLTALRDARPNGGVLVACLRRAAGPAPGWLHAIEPGHVKDFLSSFLASPELHTAVPELEIASGPTRHVPKLEPVTPSGLKVGLTDDILTGGAYRKFPGTRDEAAALVDGFLESMFGARTHALLAFESRDAWSPWFRDVAWDVTWVIADAATGTVCLICETDTD